MYGKLVWIDVPYFSFDPVPEPRGVLPQLSFDNRCAECDSCCSSRAMRAVGDDAIENVVPIRQFRFVKGFIVGLFGQRLRLRVVLQHVAPGYRVHVIGHQETKFPDDRLHQIKIIP